MSSPDQKHEKSQDRYKLEQSLEQYATAEKAAKEAAEDAAEKAVAMAKFAEKAVALLDLVPQELKKSLNQNTIMEKAKNVNEMFSNIQVHRRHKTRPKRTPKRGRHKTRTKRAAKRHRRTYKKK
jgi:hypothetical protein